MKIGKSGSSVLGTPLNHIVLVLLGFFFGFLSAISFNQVLAAPAGCVCCMIVCPVGVC